MTHSNQRSAYWDNIKGILMLLTVFAHCLYTLQVGSRAIDLIVDRIYMFHMPVFVFVSGYFGTGARAQSAKALFRMGFLYLLFQSASGFYYGFSSLLTPLYSFWYLPAIIVWRLTARYFSRYRYILPILLIISILIGFFPSIDNTFAVARILAFYPYYMVGYLLAEKQHDHPQPPKKLPLGILAIVLMGTLSQLSDSYFDYSDKALVMRAYTDPIEALGRLLLILIALSAILAFRFLIPDRRILQITMFGRNSLWIFLFHRPFTLLLSKRMLLLDDHLQIGIAVFAALLLCLIFGNDALARILNRYADSAAELLTGEADSKCIAVKITLSLIAAGYLLILISAVCFQYNPLEASGNPFLAAFRKT